MARLRPALGLLTAALALLLALGAAAQTQTGSIVFELTDVAGNPLSAATILLDSEKLAGTQVGTTDRHGRAYFPVLPPGAYTAEISLEGYLTLQKQVALALGGAPVERVLMAKGTLTEEVSVVGNKPFDTTESGTTHVFNERTIQNIQIGSGDRSYQSVLGNAPGVHTTGGNPSVRGATLGENRYLIDGVDTSDPVTGTFGLNTNFDALDQVQLSTGGIDASYGLATGGVINLITKSGGNTHDGAIDVRYYNESLIENVPHDDASGGEANQEFKRVDFSLGGPIIKDKLWYFVAASDIQSERAIQGSPVPRTFEGSEYEIKFTWQMNPNHRVAVQWMSDPAEVSADNGGPDVAPEALDFQEQGADFYKINYWGRLSDRWSLSVLAGDYQSELNGFPLRDTGVPSRIDDHTGFLSRNYNDAQFSERSRRQFGWDASYTTPNKRFHVITFGMELSKPEFSFNRPQYPGGAEEHVSSRPGRDPNAVRYKFVFIPAGPSSNEGKIVGWFLQDRWHVNTRVTLRYGLRFENVEFDRDDKAKVFDVHKAQPRLGLAWDVFGDGKRKVDFSATRSLHPAILTLANAVNTRSNLTQQLCDENVIGFDIDGNTVLDPGFVVCAEFGGPSGSEIDPGIKPTYEDEFEAGYTHAIRDNMTIGAKVSFSNTKDIMEDVLDDASGHYEIVNFPGLTRRYKGLELSYGWDARRWHVFGNWTISEAQGNVEYTQHLGTDFDINPAHSLNRFGWLHTDARHRVKVQGWVDLPRNWTIGFNAAWRSGLAFSKWRSAVEPDDPPYPNDPGYTAGYGVVFQEPRGSRRLESLKTVDTSVKKKFDFGPTALALIGSVSNLLNETTPIDRDEIDPTIVTGRQSPRTYELGLRFEF